MTIPADMTPLTAAEQYAIDTARAAREECSCGGCECGHDGTQPITPADAARMRAYLAANPGHVFGYDEDDGIIAVIIPHPEGSPEIVAASPSLSILLTAIGAPPAATLS